MSTIAVRNFDLAKDAGEITSRDWPTQPEVGSFTGARLRLVSDPIGGRGNGTEGPNRKTLPSSMTGIASFLVRMADNEYLMELANETPTIHRMFKSDFSVLGPEIHRRLDEIRIAVISSTYAPNCPFVPTNEIKQKIVQLFKSESNRTLADQLVDAYCAAVLESEKASRKEICD